MIDVNRFRAQVPIAVTIGELTHVCTQMVNFHKTKTARTSIGKITIVWRYDEGEGDTKIEQIPNEKALELELVFKGKLPGSPFSFLTMEPEQVGMANGYPIFVNYFACTVGKNGEIVSILYSIYTKEPKPTENKK